MKIIRCHNCAILIGLEDAVHDMWQAAGHVLKCPNGHENVIIPKDASPAKEILSLRDQIKSFKLEIEKKDKTIQ